MCTKQIPKPERSIKIKFVEYIMKKRVFIKYWRYTHVENNIFFIYKWNWHERYI